MANERTAHGNSGADPNRERDHLRSLLSRSLIAAPLLDRIAGLGDHPDRDVDLGQPQDLEVPAPDTTALEPVVIDLNINYRGGIEKAAERVRELIAEVVQGDPSARPGEGIVEGRAVPDSQYVVARLAADSILRLAAADRRSGRTAPGNQSIYRIWPDFEVFPHTTQSVCTVKVDAARTTFTAMGEGIVWAVLDSGIDQHRHFSKYHNLELTAPLEHKDLTGGSSPLTDEYGHGTHVAGILAGYVKVPASRPLRGARLAVDDAGNKTTEPIPILEISGMAPMCKLVSYKVLNEVGGGQASGIIAALQDIARVNDYGRNLRIHGVNLSVGYPFDPDWFACGHSPFCNEVNRLVAMGVVVVVSAGNTGYGAYLDRTAKTTNAGAIDVSINDPGNAEGAITVGATHRDSPHQYGVSFFSSKGPTGDGRVKPDLVAPGERILAPAAGYMLAKADAPLDYVEDSGTSMAAPHVSGAIAAFLSVRQEFIGQPDRVKEIFTESAVDLGRVRYFQGHGMLDLFRALQSV